MKRRTKGSSARPHSAEEVEDEAIFDMERDDLSNAISTIGHALNMVRRLVASLEREIIDLRRERAATIKRSGIGDRRRRRLRRRAPQLRA
jgi:hypothetical protein